MGNFWHNYLYPFLNSGATTTVVAIAAAAIAFAIYFIRRRDHKRDSANIILLELENAERKLAEAKKTYEAERAKDPQAVVFPEKLRLMKTASWTKYKYLFVRDFEPAQWEEIGQFYENCQYFDEAVEHKDSAFRLNEADIRSSIQQNIGQLAMEVAENIEPNPDKKPEVDKKNTEVMDDIKRKKALAIDANIKSLVYIYNPDKSFNDASYYYNLLPENITNTAIGTSLKTLAGRKNKNL